MSDLREVIATILSNRKYWKRQERHGRDITLERFIFDSGSATNEILSKVKEHYKDCGTCQHSYKPHEVDRYHVDN